MIIKLKLLSFHLVLKYILLIHKIFNLLDVMIYNSYHVYSYVGLLTHYF
jgi:hypothetical protein